MPSAFSASVASGLAYFHTPSSSPFSAPQDLAASASFTMYFACHSAKDESCTMQPDTGCSMLQPEMRLAAPSTATARYNTLGHVP